MVLNVLLLLTVATVLLAARHARGARALGFTALGLLFAAGCGPLPGLLCDSLQAPYASVPPVRWAATNTVVVLGGGTVPVPGEELADAQPGAYPRIVRAVELYRSCERTHAQCALILSGGDPKRNGVSEAQIYRSRLSTLGVPDAALMVEGRSLNTYENARYTRAILARHPADQVVLVSSALHLRRAMLHFAHAGVAATPVPADYASAVFTVLPNAYNLALTESALHEWLGIAAFHVQARLGWNPTLAGANAL